jgi:hypothetical protein
VRAAHREVRGYSTSVIKAGRVVTRDVPPHTFWEVPQAEALARVTVPLTPEYSYGEFVKGLKPIRKKRNNGIMGNPVSRRARGDRREG